MHTVMWTFKVPAGTAKAQLVETINATAHTYEGIPGLIRKYYGIAPDGGSLVGIYLWPSIVANLAKSGIELDRACQIAEDGRQRTEDR